MREFCISLFSNSGVPGTLTASGTYKSEYCPKKGKVAYLCSLERPKWCSEEVTDVSCSTSGIKKYGIRLISNACTNHVEKSEHGSNEGFIRLQLFHKFTVVYDRPHSPCARRHFNFKNLYSH